MTSSASITANGDLASAAERSSCSKCCCCLDDVVVESGPLPGGLMPEADTGYGVDFSGTVGNTGTQENIGSIFQLKVGLRSARRVSGREQDEDDSRCEMDWYERANWPKRDHIPLALLSMPPRNHWINQSMKHRLGRASFGAIADWDRAAADPCTTDVVSMSDNPSLAPENLYGNGGVLWGGVGGRFMSIDPTLDMFIVMRSGGACECKTKTLTVSVRQILKSNGQGGLQIMGSTIRFRKEKNGGVLPPSTNTMGGPY
jgi:hypothetical protein